MNSSSDQALLRGPSAAAAAPVATPDLRGGELSSERSTPASAVTAYAAAQAQGYSVGWAEGRRRAAEAAEAEATRIAEEARAAQTRREDEHHTAVGVLLRAAEELRAQVAGACARVEEQGTELAYALTRELLQRELQVAPAVDVVRRVLKVMPDEPGVRLRVAPDVVEEPVLRDLAQRGVRVSADPTLDPADAVVEGESACYDLRIGAALERVAQVLR